MPLYPTTGARRGNRNAAESDRSGRLDRMRARVGAGVTGVFGAIAGGDGSGRSARPRSRGQFVAHRVFWTLFVFATLALWLDDAHAGRLSRVALPLRLLASPLLLAVLWFCVLRWREPIRRRLRWLPLPPLLNYLVAGVPLVLLAMPPEQLPAGRARLDWRGVGLAAAAMAMAFTVLAFAWSALVDLLAP